MASEGLSGCCAAYNHFDVKIQKTEDIPSQMLQVNFFWLNKDDKESLDFLSPYAKSKIEVGSKIMLTCSSDELTKAKNKAILDRINADAIKRGRKDAHDFRVGDGVASINFIANAEVYIKNYKRPQHRIRSLGDGRYYGDKGFTLEYWETYYNRWEPYGEYMKEGYVIVSFAEDNKE